MNKKKIKCEIYRDSMQNYKKYAIPPAQLIIADVPYNVGTNFYGSNPMWYNGGDNKNGESKFAKKAAFNSDFNFNLYEYFHFCSKMLKKEDKKNVARGRSSDSPCMIVFCAFEQLQTLIAAANKHGFVHYIPLVFCKNYSPQVLKANMRIVGLQNMHLYFTEINSLSSEMAYRLMRMERTSEAQDIWYLIGLPGIKTVKIFLKFTLHKSLYRY